MGRDDSGVQHNLVIVIDPAVDKTNRQLQVSVISEAGEPGGLLLCFLVWSKCYKAMIGW